MTAATLSAGTVNMTSSNLPWLTILLVVPLVGAIVVGLLPSARMSKLVALGVSVVELAIGVAAATRFHTDGAQFQLSEKHEWMPQFGVNYALGVDGIALVLILMSLVLVPICLLAAWNDVEDRAVVLAAEGNLGARGRVQTYFALLLVLETFMVGVFSATDTFLFYVFFEAMLIPVYFLIGLFGGPRRTYAAVKFLLFSLAGGLIMLVGVIALYVQGPGGADGFMITHLIGLHLDPTTERLLFLAFFIAFAVKAPMVPVHTWLPDAATEATPATATLLVGVLDKVGTFGMIRFCLQMFPEASRWATPVVVILAVVSVLYGAIAAIGQSDMMRLIAFTSISHFGFIVLGLFAFTTTSWAASSLYMVSHGFGTAALFLFAGFLVRRRGSKRIADYGGWQRVTPVLAGVFLVAGLAGLAMPGLSSFVAEVMVLIGSFQTQPVAAVLSTLGIILAALYILLMYKAIMTGPKPQPVEGEAPVPDLDGRERTVAAPLIALLLVLGVVPNLALQYINPAVQSSLTQLHVSDPQHDHAAAAEGSHK